MMLKLLSTLRSIANAFLGKTFKPDRIDTATRRPTDTDFSSRGEPSAPKRQSAENVSPMGSGIRRLDMLKTATFAAEGIVRST
jgi:hypothetical protein